MIPTSFFFFGEFRPLWRGTSEKLETTANCTTILSSLASMPILPHIVSLIQVLMDDSIFALTPGHSSPQSVEVLQSCLWVLLF